ncbi:MAG: hypothetical protein LBS53_09870 [Synergistaceae bacterium]|jgi:hypothetical protein|nr:hypothetical protein [Synergistaceae bacterium]
MKNILECIILTVEEHYIDGRRIALMDEYGKITALTMTKAAGFFTVPAMRK